MENNTNTNKTYTYEDILALFAETDRKMKENDERWERERKEDRLIRAETEKKLKEVGKQIGGLNNKFGEFTEDLFINSLEKLMSERFHLQEFLPNAYKRIFGVGEIEMDAMGIVNGEINSVYIVEIKSKFNNEALEQLEKIMSKMNTFYPDLKDKKKIGLIAVPNLKEDQKLKIMKEGFYPVSLKDDLAIVKSPDDFIPKVF